MTVYVVTVQARGLYVFARLQDAGTFAAAVGHGRLTITTEDVLDVPQAAAVIRAELEREL